MTNSADPDQLASSDLHCLPRQGMSCSARERFITVFIVLIKTKSKLKVSTKDERTYHCKIDILLYCHP